MCFNTNVHDFILHALLRYACGKAERQRLVERRGGEQSRLVAAPVHRDERLAADLWGETVSREPGGGETTACALLGRCVCPRVRVAAKAHDNT